LKPSGSAQVIAYEIGIWLMFCTPPATIRSLVPLITACAAKCTDCCDEPHWRSIVTPGTWVGRPAASQHVRAMSPACEPTVSQQPKITSSTAPGSTPVRSISALITCAPRSAECTDASPPPRFPTGVRTASTMYAWPMEPPQENVWPAPSGAPGASANSAMRARWKRWLPQA
jgi:hypothetical protein